MEEFVPVLLLVITLLLTMVGFFLKQIYAVISNLTKSVAALQVSLEGVKGDNSTKFTLLKQITNEHANRLNHMQNKLDQYDNNINDFWKKLPDAVKQQMNESK